MVKKVADLYEQYGPVPGCWADVKRIALWLTVIIVISILISIFWK